MQENKNFDIDYLDDNVDSINFREVLEKYLSYYKWFLLGIIVAIIYAFLYLKYTPKEFVVSTTILVNGGGQSELSAFQDLGIMSDVRSSFDNELGILNSKDLIIQVVKDLKLNINYYQESFIGIREINKDAVPFKLNFITNDSILNKTNLSFYITPISETQFLLEDFEDESIGKFTYGETIVLSTINFIVTPRIFDITSYDERYKVAVSPLVTVANQLKNIISIAPVNEKSSLIKLSIIYKVKQKAELILNNLVNNYNQNAIIDKSAIAIKTNDFIGERLMVISEDLSLLDRNVESFMTSNKITDVQTEAGITLSSNSKVEEKILDLNTELKLIEYVGKYLKENSDELIPSNLGLSDNSFSQSTAVYNDLLLERNRISKTSGTKNPILINLDEKLKNIKVSISQSLLNIKSTMIISLNTLEAQKRQIDSKIRSVPKQEREFIDMKRQQQIIEALYLYLLQKREENSITLAVTAPNARIIESSFGSHNLISPIPSKIYAFAIIIGAGIPFAVLFITFLIDNKIHTTEEVEAQLKIPILADIPQAKLENKVIISNTNRSGIAEAFRLLRTNLNFMLSGRKGTSKSIFITSTVSGEGKTFTAINLAEILALSNKKVLLIGADIRSPKLAKYLNIPIVKGLTHFLMDTSLQVENLIQPLTFAGFDIIQSGVNAPNPSELLMNGRFNKVMEYAKEHYDYVVVDTPPVNVVADTLLLSENKADLFLYVIRANYLDKRLLKIPKKMYDEKRLPNMALVINGTNPTKGYGYGYGNQDIELNKSWYEKYLKK